MNEQTKIELLKIAAELSVPLINKHPNFSGANTAHNYNALQLFSDCVKTVHEQYQALPSETSE